jgi:preprotein translocase subunit SecG
MYIILTVLIVLVCIFLSIVVLIQNPKGGGVSATFSGASQQLFGASRSSDVVEKTTWTLAVLMMVFCLSSAFFIDRNVVKTTSATGEKSEIEKRANETGAFSSQPVTPVTSPAQGQAPPPQGQQTPPPAQNQTPPPAK